MNDEGAVLGAVRERTLDHVTCQQGTPVYCGPASTRTALGIHGITASEDVLAPALGTTDRGTNSVDDIARVLNEYLGDVYRTTHISDDTVTDEQIAQLKTDLVRSIDGGYALVANVGRTVRDVDGTSYTYPRGHYVGVVAYRSGGDEALVADTYIPKDYWITTSDLAAWMVTRGYAYAANLPAVCSR